MRMTLLALATLWLGTAATEAGADAVVIDSSDPAYTAGQTIAASAPVPVADGASVTLMTQSGEIVDLDGPRSGPLSGGQGADIGAVQVVSELLKGRRGRVAVLGAVRGDDPGGRPWDALNPLLDKVFCARGGAEPKITLPPRSYARTLRLEGPRKAEIAWPAAQSIADWPSSLPASDGVSYRVVLEGIEIGTVALRRITAGSTPGATAAALARAGCRRQALALLAAQ